LNIPLCKYETRNLIATIIGPTSSLKPYSGISEKKSDLFLPYFTGRNQAKAFFGEENKLPPPLPHSFHLLTSFLSSLWALKPYTRVSRDEEKNKDCFQSPFFSSFHSGGLSSLRITAEDNPPL